MSKRKKRIEPADEWLDGEPAPPEKELGESRASLAITVFWSLLALATAIVEVGVLVAGLIILWRKPIDDELVFFQRMFGMLYIASVVAGILLLAATPLLIRFRDDPPPQEIVWTGVVLGVLPLITGLLFFLFGSS